MKTRLHITCLVLAIMALSSTALAHGGRRAQNHPTYHRPQAANALRLGVVLTSDMNADEGIGVALDYDVPLVRTAGPGRLLLGPSIQAIFASRDRRFSGCDVADREQVISAAANLRYVLDIHPKLRPWVNGGVGVYAVHHSLNEQGPCSSNIDNSFTDIGPGLAVGLGVDIELAPSQLIALSVAAHSSDDDFSTFTLGFGWRF